MTFCLPVETVVAIHARLAPDHKLLYPSTLDSALARPMQGGFGQDEFYPTAVEKAAALLHGIATTQAFSDGNKRLAWTCCVVYLAQNGMTIGEWVSQDAVVRFVLDIATNVHDVDGVALQLVDWIE